MDITTNTIIVINLKVKDFLKYEPTIMAFFKSIIGPKIRNAEIAGILKCSKKPFAIKASASEHNDSKKAKTIIITIDKIFLEPNTFRVSLLIIVINVLDKNAPKI